MQSETPVPLKIAFETFAHGEPKFGPRNVSADEPENASPTRPESGHEFALPIGILQSNIRDSVRGGARWIRTISSDCHTTAIAIPASLKTHNNLNAHSARRTLWCRSHSAKESPASRVDKWHNDRSLLGIQTFCLARLPFGHILETRIPITGISHELFGPPLVRQAKSKGAEQLPTPFLSAA